MQWPSRFFKFFKFGPMPDQKLRGLKPESSSWLNFDDCFKNLEVFLDQLFLQIFEFPFNIPTNCDLEKISTQKITFLAFFGIFQKIAKNFFGISRHFRPFWKIGKNFPKIYGLEFRHIWPFSSFHPQNSSVFRISEPYNVLCRIYRITNTFLVKRRPFFVFKFRLSLYF